MAPGAGSVLCGSKAAVDEKPKPGYNPAKKATVASLVIRSEGFGEQVIRLKLGVNRLGRGPDNDFQIEHPTVSSHHCEISVENGTLRLRDCGSMNGTFVNGRRVTEALMGTGQSFSLGEVHFFVESADFSLSIPQVQVTLPAPPAVRMDGGVVCPRHPDATVTYQCTQCRELLCDSCVHRLRRRKGKALTLCPLCSYPCEPIGGRKKKKRTLMRFLHTVRIPFLRRPGGA